MGRGCEICTTVDENATIQNMVISPSLNWEQRIPADNLISVPIVEKNCGFGTWAQLALVEGTLSSLQAFSTMENRDFGCLGIVDEEGINFHIQVNNRELLMTIIALLSLVGNFMGCRFLKCEVFYFCENRTPPNPGLFGRSYFQQFGSS